MNWDGSGGLFAPTGKVKSVQYSDLLDKTQNWKYPVKGQPPADLEAFIHLL